MVRVNVCLSSRSLMIFLVRLTLVAIFLGLAAYEVGFIPKPDLSVFRRSRNSAPAVGSIRLIQIHMNATSNTSQPACVFPHLELHDPAILKFLVKYPRLDCPTEPDWLLIKNGRFLLADSAHTAHQDIRCTAFPIVKVTDFKTTELQPIVNVSNNTAITNDFYRVECTSSDGHTYRNYIAGVRHEEGVHQRPRKKLSQGLDLDVVMLGLDSTSRLAWQRHLPKSRDYFLNVLKGTEMEGYNILGDGTPAAIMPILLGHREEELHEARRGHSYAKPVDDFPWIWNEFRSAGYAIAWAEDDALLGTFQYRLVGFRNQPTDHYFRYFCVAAEPNYSKFLPDCLGSRPRHSVLLDYMNEVFVMYPDRRKWMFSFQSQLSHKDNNLLSKMDDDLLEHLRRMHHQKNLDNAIFIMLADHGGRFSKVRATAQGKQEERLPYLGIRFPEWFHEKYPDIVRNVKINSKRLTTPFDLHATLHEILNYTGAGRADISQRAVSMFKEIPPDRDCTSAQIDAHWCTCLDWQQVDTHSTIINTVVVQVIDALNNYTAPYRDLCSLLSVKNVISASAFKVKDAVLKFKETNDGGRGRYGAMTDTTKHSKILYQITLLTHPGGGCFEVTVTHHVLTDQFTVNKRDISRINKYGTQPWCVEKHDAFLRPYCHCKTAQPGNLA
ncbi:hypothetical protein BsWGS_22957 [Bradybaena similaris]